MYQFFSIFDDHTRQQAYRRPTTIPIVALVISLAANAKTLDISELDETAKTASTFVSTDLSSRKIRTARSSRAFPRRPDT